MAEVVASTPPRQRQLQVQRSSPIPERHAVRKRRRCTGIAGIAVLEGPNSASGSINEACEQPEVHPTKTPEAAFQEALEHIPAGFAEDFFVGQGCAKINKTLAANAALPVLEADAPIKEKSKSERFVEWVKLLRTGFSLLVHGVGSKKLLLVDFAEEALKPLGIVRVQMHAFDARFSLCECFKRLLEQVFPDAPRCGTSAESLGAAISAAVATKQRPICLVVHNVEVLPRHHIVILATLAASPGVYLVASVDSIWAPLAWDSRCLKDFNFCREEWNTFLGYEMESAARYPNGLPPWTGLGHDQQRIPKASLSLVLRSLTNNHRELVQAMAKRQLEGGIRGGISLSALLKESTERMIAASVPKLRSLLNELKDHEVVVQRNSSAASAQMLFSLPFNERMLRRLAESASLDSDDEAEDVVVGTAELEEEEAAS